MKIHLDQYIKKKVIIYGVERHLIQYDFEYIKNKTGKLKKKIRKDRIICNDGFIQNNPVIIFNPSENFKVIENE